MGQCCANPQRDDFESLPVDRLQQGLGPETEVIVDASTIAEFAKRLWPLLSQLAEGIFVNEVIPKLNKTLPGIFNISLRNFTIGKKPPTFGQMRIIETEKVIEMSGENSDRLRTVLPFIWDSQSGLEAVVAGFHVGVQKIQIKSEILVDWGPILDVYPILSGVSITMPDPPTIDFDLTGAATLAELPPIRSAIFKAINGGIAGSMVLPNRLGIPAGRERGVKPWIVTGPAPIGLLKVKVMKASNLPNEDMTGQSDPFVEVKIGYHEKNFKSKVINDAANPVWNEITHAFPVYTLFQKVQAFVSDSDFWTPSDAIGGLKDVYIYDIIRLSGPAEFDLYKKDGTKVENAKITLGFEWRELTLSNKDVLKMAKSVPPIKEAPREFPHVISVLVDKVIGGPVENGITHELEEGFKVNCEIPLDNGEVFEFTSSYAKKEDLYTDRFIYKRVLRKLAEKKIPLDQQAEITGLSKEQIKKFQEGSDVNIVPEFDIGSQSHVTLTMNEIQTKSLKLSLVLKDGKVLDTVDLPLQTHLSEDDVPPKPVSLKGGDQIWCRIVMRSVK